MASRKVDKGRVDEIHSMIGPLGYTRKNAESLARSTPAEKVRKRLKLINKAKIPSEKSLMTILFKGEDKFDYIIWKSCKENGIAYKPSPEALEIDKAIGKLHRLLKPYGATRKTAESLHLDSRVSPEFARNRLKILERANLLDHAITAMTWKDEDFNNYMETGLSPPRHGFYKELMERGLSRMTARELAKSKLEKHAVRKRLDFFEGQRLDPYIYGTPVMPPSYYEKHLFRQVGEMPKALNAAKRKLANDFAVRVLDNDVAEIPGYSKWRKIKSLDPKWIQPHKTRMRIEALRRRNRPITAKAIRTKSVEGIEAMPLGDVKGPQGVFLDLARRCKRRGRAVDEKRNIRGMLFSAEVEGKAFPKGRRVVDMKMVLGPDGNYVMHMDGADWERRVVMDGELTEHLAEDGIELPGGKIKLTRLRRVLYAGKR